MIQNKEKLLIKYTEIAASITAEANNFNPAVNSLEAPSANLVFMEVHFPLATQL